MKKDKNPLKGINPFAFLSLIFERNRRIKKASPIEPEENPVNALAHVLHPELQAVKVSAVECLSDDCTRFTLSPDTERGTDELAYFSAGNYISVQIETPDFSTNRPYSLCSSPKESLGKKGFYQIAVKAVPGGIVSNWILANWKVGTPVTLSAPLGNFYFQPLRDAPVVIGIAGGSGFTPFLSLAKAIAEGSEDCNLILLYGSRNRNAILAKTEFDALEKACHKIKIVHVLSEEKAEGFESGFINAEVIKKYAPANEKYSVFLCGPQGMYRFMAKELEKMHLEKKYIRYELFGEVHGTKNFSDYPLPSPHEIHILVHQNGETKTATGSTEDTILQILEKNHICAPERCRSGECGWCHSLLLKGQIFVPQNLEFRRKADFDYGWIHPCVSFPLTDIELEVMGKKCEEMKEITKPSLPVV